MSDDRTAARALAIGATFIATLALVALTRQPVLVAIWVGIWGFAAWFGWHARAGFPLFFWIAFIFFYPATSTAFTSLQEFDTFNGALLVSLGLLSLRGALRGSHRSPWFRLNIAVWVIWGLVAYLPVFTAWALSVAGVALPPPLQGIKSATSVLKSAIPMLFAWTPAACALCAIRQPEDAARFIRVVFWVALWVMALAFLQAASGRWWLPTDYPPLEGRLSSLSAPSPNGYGRLLLLPTLILLSAALVSGGSRGRRGLWAVLAVAVASIALTLSRTTYVSFTAGVFVLVLLNARRKRTVVVALALAAIVAGAAYGLGVADAFSEGSERRDTGNFDQRLELYRVVWGMVQQHPWVGLRPGGYVAALVQSDFQIGRDQAVVVSAHNTFLAVAVEWGVPMALALMAALLGAFWNGLAGLRRLRHVRAGPDVTSARIVLMATTAAAVTYGVHGLTEAVPPEYLFFAFGLSLAARYAVVPQGWDYSKGTTR